MADLAAALVVTEEVVGGGTHENDTRAWTRYTQYCHSIGLDGNYFLDRIPRQHKLAVMGAFTVAICEGQFSRHSDAPLAKCQSQIPLMQWLRPSEDKGEKTHIGTQNPTLGD